MKVKLMAYTLMPLDVMYTACRTCYSKNGATDLWMTIHSEEDMKKLILKVLRSHHDSISEHIQLTFAIDGISRAGANQLVRHRHCSYSQQSLRYVEIKEDPEFIQSLMNDEVPFEDKETMCDKYFVNPYKKDTQLYKMFVEFALDGLLSYLMLIQSGSKAEDARGLLGLNFKTNLVMTCNLREFIHICNERLCKRAQKEIRELIQEMVDIVLSKTELQIFKEFLVPKCQVKGGCTEFDKCSKDKKDE